VRLRLALLVLVVAASCRVGERRQAGVQRTGSSDLPPGAVVVGAAGAGANPAPAVAVPGAVALRPLSFAPLAKAADPAVVTIISRIQARTRSGRMRIVGGGIGSGFVCDRSGLILTNAHVIAEANDISAKLADGRELAAKIVGRDERADVAVLRVGEKDLTALALGDSDGIDVGDWVVAIGNPFGLSHTVSAGILSAKGRTHEQLQDLDENGYFNFLQTDAAINEGNSGGPLLNLSGEVIGINTAIRKNANNIGFAIPINMVKDLLPVLLRDGTVKRSALGVVVGPVVDADPAKGGGPKRNGARIEMVAPTSGAARAGLAPGDVIVALDGKVIVDPNHLRWVASLAGVGKTATVRVQRGDRVFDVPVTLGSLAVPDEREQEERSPLPAPFFGR
jgi:serine protease Do